MPVVTNKRSVLALYSGVSDIISHRIRVALAEKGVAVDIHYVDPHQASEDLMELNPSHTVPTLVDRDLVLVEPQIVLEYLDERFPHPPLMPVYPVARAKTRMMTHRLDAEWGEVIRKIERGKASEADVARKELRTQLIKLVPVFTQYPYFLNEDFSLLDCCLAPVLWRLQHYGIDLPAQEAKPLIAYAKRMFERESFIASLTEVEQEFLKMTDTDRIST